MKSKPQLARWILDSEQLLAPTPVMDLTEMDCHHSEDPEKRHKFVRLRSKDWCNILPITEDGKVVLIRQFRLGNQKEELEIPGGILDEGEDPSEAALRELEEETGYTLCPSGKIKKTGTCHPNPAIMDNRTHCYIAGPVKKTGDQNLDPGENIVVVEVPIEEISSLIAENKITHSIVLNAFLYAMASMPEFRTWMNASLR